MTKKNQMFFVPFFAVVFIIELYFGYSYYISVNTMSNLS